MAGDLKAEFSDLMLWLEGLAPGDRGFLRRLIIELGRVDWTADSRTIDERILEITREIAPERIPWVADRLLRTSRKQPCGEAPAATRMRRVTVLRP